MATLETPTSLEAEATLGEELEETLTEKPGSISMAKDVEQPIFTTIELDHPSQSNQQRKISFLARFLSIHAPPPNDDPKQYSKHQKQIIMFLIALAGLIGPIASTIYYPVLIAVQQDLQTTETLVNTTISVFVLFLGIAPLIWASFSDIYGRRTIYISSFIVFIIGTIASSVARNIWILMVFRAIQAVGSSAVQSIGAGTISDIYIPSERGTAMGLFYLGPLLGPLIGPIIGGFMAQAYGWRSLFYFLAVLGGLILLCIFFLLPETFRTSKSKKPSKSRFSFLHINPLSPLKLLIYPSVDLVCLQMGALIATFMLTNTLLPYIFTAKYNFSTSDTGLTYLAGGAGLLLGSLGGGRFADWTLRKMKERRKKLGLDNETENGGEVTPKHLPELRLASSLPGLILAPAGILMYGITLDRTYPFEVPLVGQFLFGIGLMIISTSTNTYLVDAHPGKAASVIALNNLFRSVFGAITTSLAEQAADGLGYTWLYVTLGVVCGAFGLFPLLLFFWGEHSRNAVDAWKKERDTKKTEANKKIIGEKA